MDPAALATLLKDYGPWGLLALSLIVNKALYDRIGVLQDKVEDTLNKWREDSQAQSDKLGAFLERAAERRGRG